MREELAKLEVNDLSFKYIAEKNILKDISMQVLEKESVAIIGANGAGKSTLLKTIVGLNMDFEGTIFVNGIELAKKTLPQIRERLGYVFQDSDNQLFLSTVYQDVAFGPKNYGYTNQEVEQRTLHALRMVNIEHLKDRQTFKLSGGEKKLVSIATILSMKSDMILLDEPSVALDPRNRKNLIELLNQLKITKIVATHDLDLVWDTCERTIILSDGCIVKDGATKDILRNQDLLQENGLELPLFLSKKHE